jgi:cell division protease FtsH
MYFSKILFQIFPFFSLGIVFSLVKDSSNSIIQAIKFKDFLLDKPLGSLYQDIENQKIDSIYFSSDLKTIYSHHLSNYPSIIYDYDITNSNPLLANNIIEFSNKNKIESTILVDPVNPYYNAWNNGLNLIGKTFDTLFFPTLILLSILSFINMRNNPSAGFTSFNNNNPFQNNNNLQKDKINMQNLNISLKSWAGSPEIFEECMEVVSYLNNNTLYKNAGAEIPKGILLEGPPGTGKTLLAKAIASEANASFVAVSASEFMELFVGMGAAKVRNIFAKARENTPAIIFIDEIDSIGRQRGAGVNMGNDEREQTLNQLLSEMDGFALNQDILVIAATNRKDILDSALLRPGRFDRIIYIGLPDKSSRKSILETYLKNKIVDFTVNIDLLSEMTAGFSGAQIKNFINEAAIFAARLGSSVITQENLENAIEKLVVGIVKKKEDRSEEVLQRIAIHEVGHGFLAYLFNEYFQLQKITIQSTYNGAGGFTLFNEYPEIKDGGLFTKDLLMKRLTIALGGKAAESVFYDDKFMTVGAMQDLKQANNIAQKMIGNFGMGNELKVFYNENIDTDSNPFLGRSLGQSDKYSDKTKEMFDYEVDQLLQEAYSNAIDLIHLNKNTINDLANVLRKNISLSGEDVNNFLLENKINIYPFTNI